MRSLPEKHTTHIYLADLVVVEKLLALASWRAHLTAKKAQLQHLAAFANLVKI
jgi:hypothetical protein